MKTFHNPEAKSVTFLDERFYTLDNENFYPSVTTVLDIAPKGWAYEEWLRNVGQESKRLLREAATQGTKVHNAIDALHRGEKIEWRATDDDGNANYTLIEWEMIIRYIEFYETCKPKIVGFEFPIVSPQLGVGGRIDMVCDIDGCRYLIDVKTSNYMHDTYEMQVATYATMFNLNNKPKDQIKRTAILWLKAQTRGPRKGLIQGKGWQLKEFDRDYAEAFEDFKDIQRVWKRINPECKPKNITYPDTLILPAA